jgi:hypothetical protein
MTAMGELERLLEIRDRMQRKVHQYYTCARKLRDNLNRRLIYRALDSLLDVSRALAGCQAATSFERAAVGLDMIEEIFEDCEPSSRNQHKLELVYGGLRMHLDDIRARLRQLDDDLRNSEDRGSSA